MLLHTPHYLLFLIGVAVVHRLLPAQRWPRARSVWLLFASYAFCLAFDVRFAALLLALTTGVYWLVKAIPNSSRARIYAGLSIALSLLTLGIFKYNEFFISNLNDLVQLMGGGRPAPSLKLLLPIGISFYTFQAISYTMEVYRGTLAPVSRWDELALYLAFFPKLLAGPIVSPARFMPQADARPGAVWPAIRLITLGLIKKVVIADSLASLSQVAFRAAGLPPDQWPFPAPLYWQGFYLYAIQIYADFSGYTDIARGSAALLGIALPENFERPYFASTLGEFWNRWHISLTMWFREYLFFPLSRTLIAQLDRRYLIAAQVISNLITMTLIGLWHGAGWTYIAWGVWHGVLLSIERVSRYRPTRRWHKIVGGLVTFHLVGLGWVLFASNSFATAWRFLMGLISTAGWQWLPHLGLPVLVAGSLLLALELRSTQPLWLRTRGRPVLLVASWTLIASLWLLRAASGNNAIPFIYGQF